MFRKEIHLNTREVTICIFSKPVFQEENVAIFGYPLENENLLEQSPKEFGNVVKGIWLKITWTSTEISILTDILGGFRVYYYSDRNKFIISDDYKYIIQNSGIKPVKHNEEYEYWLKHKYTSGGATLIQDIYKINPATKLKVTDKEHFEESYFHDLHRKSNVSKHAAEVEMDLNDTFYKIKRYSEKVILLFSGGKDSCLLLKYLIKHEIDFVPVFFKLKKLTKHAAEDLVKVRTIAYELGLNLEEIQIDVDSIPKDYMRQLVEKQLFDRHFSLLHYYGIKLLTEKYGSDLILINGQSSDNIFSFGPSETSLMSYFRRNIMYRPRAIISKLGIVLLALKTRKTFRFPKNEEEKLFALFDDYKYTRVIESNVDKEYFNYFYNYLRTKTLGMSSFYSKEMYCRILSYCQGSDNQVVVNSARYNNVKVVMPFATPNIIYSTVKYKNEMLDIIKPKYVIDNILDQAFQFNYKDLISRGESKAIMAPKRNIKGNTETVLSELYKEVYNQIIG